MMDMYTIQLTIGTSRTTFSLLHSGVHTLGLGTPVSHTDWVGAFTALPGAETRLASVDVDLGAARVPGAVVPATPLDTLGTAGAWHLLVSDALWMLGDGAPCPATFEDTAPGTVTAYALGQLMFTRQV